MNYLLLKEDEFNAIINELKLIKEQLKERNESSELARNIITNDNLSQVLGVTTRTLQTYRDNQGLTSYKIGSKIYYKQEEVQKWIESNGVN